VGAWYVLRWTWSATVVGYCVLALIASKRLHGREKTLNHVVLLVVAGLVGVRIWIGYTIGGQVYRLAVLIVGVAAGIAALLVLKMLLSPSQSDRNEVSGAEDGIQSLKLN
jgi:hypothetical protein